MPDFPRLKKLPPYVFAITNSLKEAIKAKGIFVYDFAMGNPDLPTPKHIINTLVEAANQPENHRYSNSKGIPELRAAICNWYSNKYQVNLNPETEALVSIGSKEGLAHLAMALVDTGDKVLVPSPCYPVHMFGSVIAGAEIIQISLTPFDDFLLRFANLLAKHKPKVAVLNFPANPSTHCVDLDFMKEIVRLAKQYGTYIIHDFAYAEIAFDGYQPPSILQIPGAKDIAIESYSLSKSYNMSGWRVGFLCGNQTVVQALAKMKSYIDYGTFAPIEWAAVEALTGPQDCVQEICEIYKQRRDQLCAGLNKMGWSVQVPKASMFVWAKIPQEYVHLGSLEFSKLLLEQAHVAVSPGIGFGEGGDDHVRFALIQSQENTQAALEKLNYFFSKTKSPQVSVEA